MKMKDPRWTEMSASRRRGLIYLKIPRVDIAMLLFEMKEETLVPGLIHFLRKLYEECEEVDQPVLVWSVTLEKAKQDIEDLRPYGRRRQVARLIQVLERGLAGDPDVDWISRVGGPRPAPEDQEEKVQG